MKDKFKKLFGTIVDFIQSKTDQKTNAIRQQKITETANTIAMYIHQELYDIFRNSQYTFLNSVSTPNDIRFLHWIAKSNLIIYTYQIYTEQIPNTTVLHQCKNDLSNDIYKFQQTLIAQYGFDYARSFYPCITQGLYIINIKPVGCMVQFNVVTNYYI